MKAWVSKALDLLKASLELCRFVRESDNLLGGRNKCLSSEEFT